MKLIIEYWLETLTPRFQYGAICCGMFESWEQFDRFCSTQASYNKRVSQVKLIKIN